MVGSGVSRKSGCVRAFSAVILCLESVLMHWRIRSLNSLNMSPRPCPAHTDSVSPSFISRSWEGLRTEANLSPDWNNFLPVMTSARRQP